ncbi:MAG: NAD(P)-dependent oxidoreductase [Alphaproteobacteria bacterium]|nr:NAD(P)-dependent oxidoreductase [Alphaproteobacteria bacterium]MCB9796423.1 NAD(P)-dependent oxidoreductase [Alphaproteobacteria bacterium]
MKVFMTGATTPLGRRVFDKLSGAHQMALLVRPEEEAAWEGPTPDCTLIVSDPVTPERYGPALAGADVVLHLGELSQAPDPRLVHVNLKGTQSLLHALSAYGPPRLLVHLSTALLQDPAPEDPDADPGLYGSTWLATRASAEARVALVARRLRLETLIVRAGHGYGAAGIDGPLSGWLDLAAESAERDGKLTLEGEGVPLPFVRVGDLAEAIAGRVAGRAAPGERRLVGALSRVEAVGMLASLGQVHDRLCRMTERAPQRQERSLRRRLVSRLAPERALPELPAFLRAQPVSAPNAAWVKRYGPGTVSEVSEALVGGAC